MLGSVLFYHDNFTADQGICDQDGVYTQTITLDDQTVFLNCYNKRIVMQHYSESISKDAINPFDVLVEDYYKGINGKILNLLVVWITQEILNLSRVANLWPLMINFNIFLPTIE